ncbi:MAG: membrane protein insertion efficiency factor YidD [Candidatus Rokubacteria bacterium]|nr:membrane protein insertion efficiency factor YidD [Candidatus Rokubacteria bacterium]
MTVFARVLVLVIRGYQRTLSPWLGGGCRFAPTCSEYGRLAVIEHGALRGGALAIRRLARCHPFHPGGYDPPPARPERVR